MTLADDLDYHHGRVNAAQRVARRFATTRGGAWLFSKSLRHVDRLVARVTRGRTTAPEVLAGLPVVWVTTTGARSGVPRSSPLAAIPDGDNLALVGTNFGGRATPAWCHNLRAHPDATLRYRDREVAVRAREAAAEERTRILARAEEVYAGYGAYQVRITNREIPVLVLERG